MFHIGIALMTPRNFKIIPIKSSSITLFEEWSSMLEEENFEMLLNRIHDGELNPDELLINGLTPLHIACIQGNSRSVRFLLDLGVDVNPESNMGRTPLDEALFYKHFKCVIELMKNKVKLEKINRKAILDQLV